MNYTHFILLGLFYGLAFSYTQYKFMKNFNKNKNPVNSFFKINIVFLVLIFGTVMVDKQELTDKFIQALPDFLLVLCGFLAPVHIINKMVKGLENYSNICFIEKEVSKKSKTKSKGKK